MNTRFQKGHTPWSKGKKMPHSEETKEKMRKSHIGKKLSKEHRESLKGRIPWNKDKKETRPDVLKKLSQSAIGKHIGEKNPNYQKFGKKHPCWKENKVQSLKSQIRATFKYRQWRSDVFQRDSFICVWCGFSKGNILEADHIIPFADILIKNEITTLEQALECEELWNINNGITLCRKCHEKTYNWGKRGKNRKRG